MKHGRALLLLPLKSLLRHRRIYLISLFLTSLTFGLFLKGIINAQTPSTYDVTVSPVFFDLSTNPGSLVSDRIRVRNNTSSPLPIKIEVKRLTGDENGALTLKDTSDDNSLSWIKFESTRIVAKPLEWTNIPFKIEVPTSAAYGYYYAVSLTQDKVVGSKTTGATITGAAAIPILLNVRKEGAKFEGKLVSFKTDSNMYDYPPVNFITKFENTGNVHIRPRGNIFVKDMLGRQIAILDVNQASGAVLPNSQRFFESTWTDGFIVREPKMEDGQAVLDKNGKPKTSLKIKFEKILDLRIGRYTADALLVISTSERDIPFQAETSFIVFPWLVVLGSVLFIIFAGVGLFSTFKKIVLRILRIFRK